jgi:hypothetical protein
MWHFFPSLGSKSAQWLLRLWHWRLPDRLPWTVLPLTWHVPTAA